MIKKTSIKGITDKVSVTFETSAFPEAKTLSLVGDFNAWDPDATPMKQRKDGAWAVTLRLPKRRDFQYRFVVDGQTWTTDAESETTAPNPYGGVNAVVLT